MSYNFDSRLGEYLYSLLPEVYRTRDRYGTKPGETPDEDLARYLDAHGHLLDLIHTTLEQQLQDTLPATSQEWLLPYFAQLLAVNIMSPDAAGKHAEVDNAVSWRQRKGTVKVAEQIAEAVGQMEARIQEGWQRVAMTPRVGMPQLPVSAVDSTLEIDQSVASRAALHPSLPAATVDLRRPSRAVEAQPTNPAARQSTFGGLTLHWRQLHRHGAPCFLDSFEDVSRRTVDIRTPGANQGHYHHKRLLAYVAPPDGLIPREAISLAWEQRSDSLYEHLLAQSEENGVTVIRNNTGRTVVITDDVALDAGAWKIEGIHFTGELAVASGGTLELVAVEAGRIDVPTPALDEPVVAATDCLFGELSAGGLVQLDSSTVRETAFLTAVVAVDSLFTDIVGTNVSGVLEYCCYPDTAPLDADAMTTEDSTIAEPAFFDLQTALAARSVLAPATPPAVYAGGSDGGEIGYYHRGREGRAVRLEGDFSGADALSLPADGGYPLLDLVFTGDLVVGSGRPQMQRCAIGSLTVETALATGSDGEALPSVTAVDCLFGEIDVTDGLARLEYCTVMQDAHCLQLQASDCNFAGQITDGDGGKPEAGCLRYSRIPAALGSSDLHACSGHACTNTSERPQFMRFDYCSGGTHEFRLAAFGEPGYGVLDRSTPDAIRFGAEDGAEMGGHHHKYYSLKIEAVLDKMCEFLPVGIEPVLIQDRRLLRLPPELTHTSNGGSP